MNNYQHAPRGYHVGHRRANPAKVIGIMIGCLVALALVVYAGVAFYFSGRFMPNTTAGGVSLSLMSANDAEKALQSKLDNYTLSISGQGLDLQLTAADAGLAVNTSSLIKDMLNDVNPWLWPFQIAAQHDESAKLVAAASGTNLANAVTAAVEEFNASATPAANATISYNATTRQFDIIPESVGTALDVQAVVDMAEQALSTLSHRVSVTAEQLQQPTIFSTDPRLNAAIETANTMTKANVTLTMGDRPLVEVGADLIAEWITIDGEANAALGDDALNAWAAEVAEEYGTVGATRSYARPDGKQITVQGGVYGWEIDGAALAAAVKDAVTAGGVQSLAVPTVTYGDAYNGPGAADWGPRYLDIDLAEQHARFYDESGALVWESDIVSGMPDGEHDTPSGVYWMNQKESPSTLNGYSGDTKIYETVVQYWMPFVGGAIGLHDADWQAAFGGTRYADGYGSHGCVNLPPAKAAELYNIVQGGDVVVCHW